MEIMKNFLGAPFFLHKLNDHLSRQARDVTISGELQTKQNKTKQNDGAFLSSLMHVLYAGLFEAQKGPDRAVTGTVGMRSLKPRYLALKPKPKPTSAVSGSAPATPFAPTAGTTGGTSSTLGAFGKRVFLRCHFILKMIFLPRHARDKHRENSKQSGVFVVNGRVWWRCSST
jgi:hypothetical protein